MAAVKLLKWKILAFGDIVSLIVTISLNIVLLGGYGFIIASPTIFGFMDIVDFNPMNSKIRLMPGLEDLFLHSLPTY